MSQPSLSPVGAPQVVCPNCKSIIEPETAQGAKKAPTEVKYVCVNEEKNCAWSFTLSSNHVNGEYTQLKDEDLKKRREQIKAAAAMRETHEAKVRRLIMLLPHLESMLQALGDGTEGANALPAKPETKTKTEPAAV